MELRVISGNANRSLAEEIVENLGIKLTAAGVKRFSDGETQVRIEENVRGTDCFVIQPTCPPVNESVMELLVICDALRRSSARRITAVIPYYGYGRQDRKAEPRVPITSKLVANLLVASGINRIVAMDLHAGQIQGFFDIPVDHLYAMPVFLNYIREKNYPHLTIVSPDAGGVERARAFAKRLNADLVIVDKRRPKANEAEIMNIIGEVEGKTAIILDDIVDTAGTMVKVAHAIKKAGAIKVLASCSHGVLSGEAHKKLDESPIEELLITNSIPLAKNGSKKVKVLSVASLFAEAIRGIHLDKSISELFV